MRTAAAFLLALGVSFGALLFAGLGTTPVQVQDVSTLDGDDGAWIGGDEGWFEDEGYGARVEDQPYYGDAYDDGGAYDDEAGLYGDDEWWDWTEDAGEVSHESYDRTTGDEGFDAWYGASDELF